MVRAVLFDMDGVLVDSEELIFLAAEQMFREHGVTVTKADFKPFIGTGENSYLGNVAKKYGLSFDIEKEKKRTYDIYTELAGSRLKLIPGVNEFIARCRARNLKLAVATSADEIKMLVNLKAAKLDKNVFNATVNGLEVEHKKPDPEIYLKAAEKLGTDPKECLVIEDAVNGIEAAKKAGAKCVALTTSFPYEALSRADWVFNNLHEITDAVFG